MRLGIKVGPRDWKEKLARAKYDAVEVALFIDRVQEYEQLFRFLKDQQVVTGLHYWGTLAGDILPTIAVNIPDVVRASLRSYRRTIELVGEWEFDYALFHVSAGDLWRLSPTKELTVKPLDLSWEDSWRIRVENLKALNQYAKEHKVRFILENTPRNEPKVWGEDIAGTDIYPDVRVPSPDQLEHLAQMGMRLCLDLAHLATWYGPTTNRSEVFEKVKDVITEFKPYVDVLHLASIKPPFVTDTGNGFTPEECLQGVFPNSREMLKFLEIARDRDLRDHDLIVIPEPRAKDHLWHNAYLGKSGIFYPSGS